MADDEELAAMAATHGLSARGAAATRPPFSYLHAFFRAMSEPFDATERPDGYVNLAVAQNFLTVDAVQRRLMAGFASPQPASTAAYDNMKGSERLRTAMAAHMHRILAKGNHSVKVHPDELCISAGCGAILDNLFMCITEPNDGVLIPAPYYPAFDNDLRVRNGTVAIPVLGDDAASLPTPKQLDDAVASAKADGRTVKALLLTNPSNPLGVVYGESLLDAIIWGLTNGMHVVVDEVYASSVFHETLEPDTGKPLNPFVSAMTLETMLSETEAVAKTKLHVVYGLSKDFCASGYRVGVLRTRNEGVLKAMDNVAYFCTLPGPMQHAVADMLEDREWVDGYLAENAANLKAQHDALTDALADAEIPVVNATAGMFVWVDLSRWMSESNWEEENRLWTAAFESAKIVMTPGKDCRHGTPGCFRLCFASVTREALTTAVGRLKELLAGY